MTDIWFSRCAFSNASTVSNVHHLLSSDDFVRSITVFHELCMPLDICFIRGCPGSRGNTENPCVFNHTSNVSLTNSFSSFLLLCTTNILEGKKITYIYILVTLVVISHKVLFMA